MPIYPSELTEWWMTCGYDSLVTLVDCDALGHKPQDVGFAQAAQHQLRSFDNNHQIHEQLHAAAPGLQASSPSNYEANRRKNLNDAAHRIFKAPKDGGVVYDYALQGLGFLDAMEAHRLRLLTTVENAMVAEYVDDGRARVAQELHQTAAKRYNQFYMGFRASVSISPTAQN